MSEPPQPARPIRNLSDAEAAELAAAMKARSAELDAPTTAPTPIGSLMPAAARIATVAAAGGVLNPKIWDADVKRFRSPHRFDTGRWFGRVRACVAAGRATGDVLAPTIERACDVLTWLAREGDRTCKVQVTFEVWAKRTKCCVSTIVKVARWLEDEGLVNTFNVLTRAGNLVLRGANLYLLTMPEMPAAAPEPAAATPEAPAAVDAPAPELHRVRRMNNWLDRWAPWFGLVGRAWGLNATPLATHRKRGERRPAPA